MKKTLDDFDRVVLDLEFKPYVATYRNSTCLEIVIRGFSSPNINEAIEQANLALYDYISKIYDELGLDYKIDECYEDYILCEIKIA